MMAKKNFDNINTNRVYNAISEVTAEDPVKGIDLKAPQPETLRKPRKTYSAAESAEAQQNFKTQGLKGVKLPRINVAFSPDNYEYIKIMASFTGVSMTQLINDIIDVSRERNADTYEDAKSNKREFIF